MGIFAFILKAGGAVVLFMVGFAWLTGTMNPQFGLGEAIATVVTAIVALVVGVPLGRRHPVK
jgi:ABC-type phosphate transport system permease subunit